MRTLFGRLNSLATTSTAKDTYWVFGSNLFTSFLAFLYTIFLARVLSPEGWGIFSAVIGYMLVVSDIGDLGISSGLASFLPPLIKKQATYEIQSFTKTAFLFQSLVLIFLICGTLIFAHDLAQLILKQSNLGGLMVIVGGGVAASMILSFANSLLTAEKKFKQLAVVMAISTLVKLILVYLFFLMHRLNLVMAVTIFATSPLISIAYYLLYNPPLFLSAKFNWLNLKKLLSFSMYLGLARIFSAISGRLDALMIIPLSSSFTAGIYQGAFKIASVFIMLSGSFSQVIAPRLASISSFEVNAYLKKIIGVTMLMWLGMGLAYLVAPFLVVFVLGQNYRPSIGVFQTLLLPMALFVGTIPSVNYLIYFVKKPFVSTINTAVQLIIVFLGNLYFIPKYGSYGPVWSLTIAYTLTLGIATFFALYYHRRQTKPKL